MKIALEIINYFRNDEMVNDNTPFSIGHYDLALKEIEEMQNQIKQIQEDKEEYKKMIMEGLK